MLPHSSRLIIQDGSGVSALSLFSQNGADRLFLPALLVRDDLSLHFESDKGVLR